MTTLATIGTGAIGGTVARLAVAAGYEVIVANSRGPESLASIVAELGPMASAATAREAAGAADLVLVSVPLAALDSLPDAELANKIVLDTNNYYPDRDGQIEVLDNGSVIISRMLQQRLPASRVVRVFNNIAMPSLRVLHRPRGAADRSALPIAGDDAVARSAVARFVDDIGFDAVVVGSLEHATRFDRYTPAYVQPYLTDGDYDNPRVLPVAELLALIG